MSELWLGYKTLNPKSKQRLFCFPWAGGSASGYKAFIKDLQDITEVCPVELPGRGTRLSEAPFKQMLPLVDELFKHLQPYFDRPFAFWGHSMGAILAFELTRKLYHRGKSLPTYLFLSGHRAPQLPNPDPTKHLLSDPDLAAHLQDLGGTPPEVLANPEMLQLILPAFRADLTALNTYQYKSDIPLLCPIYALGGIKDIMLGRNMLDPWRQQTAMKFNIQLFPGGHFYLNSVHPMLMQILRQTLNGNK